MTKPTCEDTFVIKKRNLGNDYYSLTFAPYRRVKVCRPGHFVHILLPSTDVPFRRAFSIANTVIENQELEIIFKVFGRGTRLLSSLRKGDTVNVLGPLGVPFRMPGRSHRAIIVAGGIGYPPLLYLAAEMVRRDHPPDSIEFFYGGKSAPDILDSRRIKRLGVNFHPVTEDGSLGRKGLITEPVERFIKDHGTTGLRIYGCGPEGMLKATDALGLKYGIPGQISVEAPMPCGTGICLGCVVPLVKGGYARVCCDGPVFALGEIDL